MLRQGSHPGPLSFWVLAPFYKVFGSSAWALQAATASLNAIAIGLSLMIARRRGGAAVQLGIASMLAVVTYYYGPSVLTQAWNPYLPMMWFIVVVLGVWSVLCDDLAMLPVATFAAVFCLQTHISYLGLVGGLGALAAVWLVWSLVRRRAALGPRPWRWILLALGIVALTSVPIIVQQLTHTPGNLTIIWEHFTSPPETPIGIREGVNVLLVHLNPWRLLTGQDATTGTVIPGVVLLAAWVLGAVVALRARLRTLVALNLVIAVSLALGALSIANIFGFVWYYLMLWAWAINALMLFSTGWTAATVFGPRLGREAHDPARGSIGVLTVVLASAVTAYLIGFGIDASTVEPPTPRVSAALGELVGPTVRAIDDGAGPGGGRSGRYQITIFDPVTINAPGYGLLSELERSGIHAGFPVEVRTSCVTGGWSLPGGDGCRPSLGGPDIALIAPNPAPSRSPPRTCGRPRSVENFRPSVGRRRELIVAGRDLVPNLDENIFTAVFVDNRRTRRVITSCGCQHRGTIRRLAGPDRWRSEARVP